MIIEHKDHDKFATLIALPEERLELVHALLIVAAEECPGLDENRYKRELDRLAEEAREFLSEVVTDREKIEKLMVFFKEAWGFRGNEEEYYDPRNNYLNHVLDRRIGIPITLTVILVEVGRRLGLPIEGINFPGHFLARCRTVPDMILDPFFGEILDYEECESRLKTMMGPHAHLHEGLLEPATSHQILTRILGNLKGIYLQQNDSWRALSCCERLLLLNPHSPLEIRDRGLVYEKLDCFRGALADFEAFLTLAPHHPSALPIRARLGDIRYQVDHLS